MDKKSLKSVFEKLLSEWKGKRKFKQSVELILNLRGIDLKKPENRINLQVILPKGKGGKERKIAVFCDDNSASLFKGVADLVITKSEMDSYRDKAKLRKLLKEYDLLAQPQLMAQVAKSLGQFLGPKGKMPKPVVGNPKDAVERAKKTVSLSTRGKQLPTLQSFVGVEDMSVDELVENSEAVYEALKNKVGGEGNIKSVYVKLTMSPAIKVR